MGNSKHPSKAKNRYNDPESGACQTLSKNDKETRVVAAEDQGGLYKEMVTKRSRWLWDRLREGPCRPFKDSESDNKPLENLNQMSDNLICHF